MLRPPRPTRPDTLVPYTPLCRSLHQREKHRVQHRTFGNVDQPVTFPLVEAKHHPALPLLHAKARPAAASGGGEMWFLHIGSAYPLLGQRMANTVGYEGAIGGAIPMLKLAPAAPPVMAAGPRRPMRPPSHHPTNRLRP